MSMSDMLGKLNLGAFRYCVLIVFLVCNALVASTSIWNLDLVRGSEMSDRASLMGIDSYSTFLGCSGLILFFTVAFVEIAQINCFLALVWFECLWVSLWGLMYLAAGITLGVFASRENCNIADSHSRCNSTHVMLAFTWFCAVTLLIYFSAFMFAVCINKKKDATILMSTMRKFPWSGTCIILAGSPITPSPPPPVVQTRYQNSVPIIRAPKPKHARSNPNRREPIFSWRSGLSEEYQIEHFSPANVESGPSQIANLPPAATAPIVRTSILPALGVNVENNFASSLYPSFLQPCIPIPISEPAHLRPVSNQPSMRAVPRTLPSLPQSNSPLSPLPLGDWPRRDIISRSTTKGKRKQVPVFQYDAPPVAAHSESRVHHERPGPGEGHLINHSSYAPARLASPNRRSGSFAG